MVDRQLNSQAGATVVDLDGTYCRLNTLKAYIRLGFRRLLSRGKIASATTVAALVAMRRLRLISHRTMKFNTLRLIGRDTELLNSFGTYIKESVNTDVMRLLDRRLAAGDRILLASAAADFYIPAIWNGEFVATAMDKNAERLECRGEEKLRRVSLWLETNGLKLNYVLTDHHDDAPLMQANVTGENILVNPSDETLRFFRELEPTHFFLIEELADNVVTR